jgi:hypothetical protein
MLRFHLFFFKSPSILNSKYVILCESYPKQSLVFSLYQHMNYFAWVKIVRLCPGLIESLHWEVPGSMESSTVKDNIGPLGSRDSFATLKFISLLQAHKVTQELVRIVITSCLAQKQCSKKWWHLCFSRASSRTQAFYYPYTVL